MVKHPRVEYALARCKGIFHSIPVFIIVEITTGATGGWAGGLLGAAVGVCLPLGVFIYHYVHSWWRYDNGEKKKETYAAKREARAAKLGAPSKVITESKAHETSELVRLALDNALDFQKSAKLYLEAEDKSGQWLKGVGELRAGWKYWIVNSATPLLTRAQRIEFQKHSNPIPDKEDPGKHQYNQNLWSVTPIGGATPEAKMRGIASGADFLRAELLQEHPKLTEAPKRSSR